MNALVSAALDNLLSPALLFFALGLAAAAMRSDLEVPPPIAKGLSLYLMAAIGFKGGAALAASAWTAHMAVVAAVAALLSLLTPFLAYALLRWTTRLEARDAAAVGATYGSVSVVTFVTAAAFLQREGVAYSGYLVAVMALMEAPAIVTGLALARRAGATAGVGAAGILREAVTSGSVVLLLGALAIGWATGERGVALVGDVLIGPFHGVLALFLLEMGLLVARRLRETRALDRRVLAFGLYMPVVGAAVGLAIAAALGLDAGDGTLLMVLAASASYIAVPAALRVALPEANPSVYVTLSLAVTFPFNVVLGIPVYYAASNALLAPLGGL